MNADSFFVQFTDDGPIYHGAADCEYSEARTFKCRKLLAHDLLVRRT